VTISSVGFVAIRMRGERPCFSEGSVFASFGLPPGRRSTCPEAFASASAVFRSLDGFFSGSQVPSRAFAVIQPSKTCR
jgi:hypothetical protein